MAFQSIQTILKSEDFKEAIDWLDIQQKTMLDLVIEWAQINSGSHNLDGIATMATQVLKTATCLEADVTHIDLGDGEWVTGNGNIIPTKNGKILCLRKRPEAKYQVLLTGHLDTVFATDHPFQDITWLDDSTLNGPGVADMKGGILVMLHALMALERSSFAKDIGWQVMLSPDEETGSLASGQHLMEAAPNFHVGMTYEPALADGTLAGKRKGSGNYSLIVKGVSAHAGRAFYDGRNAVVALADMMTKLSALSGKREGLTVNPAVISGGSAPNVVPDNAVCRFNVRLEKMEDAAWFEEQVKQIIQPWQSKQGYDVVLHGGINRPPKEISTANQAMMDFIAECGKSIGLTVDYVATGGCCEGNNLAAAGLPNVDTLGVRGGMIHSDKEFLMVDSLAERAKLSALILMAIAVGGFDEMLHSAAQK